jgi:hypothetical protein
MATDALPPATCTSNRQPLIGFNQDPNGGWVCYFLRNILPLM